MCPLYLIINTSVAPDQGWHFNKPRWAITRSGPSLTHTIES